jgi:hypothetical protein
MPLGRLELKSIFGDQTMQHTRFAVHGTSNQMDAIVIIDGGLRFAEGQAVVSTDLVYAHEWTQRGAEVGSGGEILILALPANYYLGYAAFTSAFVDRAAKQVLGAPLEYAAGRKKLSLYTTSDVESGRLHAEAEVASGYTLNQHPQYLVDNRYLIGRLSPGPGLDALIQQLDVAIHTFEPIDLGRYERSFADLLRLHESANSELAAAGVHSVLIGTVESIAISRLRTMRWQGLRLLGYAFLEGQRPIEVGGAATMDEQRKRMDEMGRSLASSALFVGELAWLKQYVEHELELMRLELEAADLEDGSI